MEIPPHVLAFVQAQTANLQLYAIQGAALLSSYLSAQPQQAAPPRAGSRPRSASSDLAVNRPGDDGLQERQPPSSPPAPHPLLGAGGVSGVDVLNAARASNSRGGPSSKVMVPGPIAPTASRLVDRMKGRSGAAAGTKAVRTTSKVDVIKRTVPPAASPPRQPVVEVAARVREGSVIQTRAELRQTRVGRVSDITDQHGDKSVQANGAKHRRKVADGSTANHKTRSTATKALVASCGESGVDENSSDERRAAMLEERRQRRRAKAAIVRPQPIAATAESEGSVIIVGASSEDGDLASFQRPTKRTRPAAREDDHAKRAGKSDRTTAASQKRAVGGRKVARTTRESKRLGLGPLDTFKATNVVDGRLTLRRRDGARPGVFNKGVASSRVAPEKGARVRGVPDLVFSERDFLARPRPISIKSHLQGLSPIGSDISSSSSSSSSSAAASSSARIEIARHPAAQPSATTAALVDKRPIIKEQEETVATVPAEPQPEAVSRYFRSTKADSGGILQKEVAPAPALHGSLPASASVREGSPEPRRQYSPSWPESNEAEAEVEGRADGARTPDDVRRSPLSPAAAGNKLPEADQPPMSLHRSRSPASVSGTSPTIGSEAGPALARTPSPRLSLGVDAPLYLPPTLICQPSAAVGVDLLPGAFAAPKSDSTRLQLPSRGWVDIDTSQVDDGPSSDCDDSLHPFEIAPDDLDPSQPQVWGVDSSFPGIDLTGAHKPSFYQPSAAPGPLMPLDWNFAPDDGVSPTLGSREDYQLGVMHVPDPVEGPVVSRRHWPLPNDDPMIDPSLDDTFALDYGFPRSHDVDDDFCSIAASEDTTNDIEKPLDLLAGSLDNDALEFAFARHWHPHRT